MNNFFNSIASGTLIGEKIGNIGDLSGPNTWVKGNAYGQREDSEIRTDDNNAIDPNTILLYVPKGYDVNTDEIVLSGGTYTYYRSDGTAVHKENTTDNTMVIRTVTIEITPEGGKPYRILNSSDVTNSIDK